MALRAYIYSPFRGLRLTPTFLLQRLGYGDFRQPFPHSGIYGQPALFLGVKETTLRFALAGRYQPVPFFWVGWDAGPNFVSNKGHVTGVKRTEFEGTAEMGVRLEFP